ncbi:polycystin family receptor for egg jelly-like [Musca autumnalis]|uniref:polycystin family receptor for egg jelly-like n=1 Tax=Musca autumnalis TaxID=221902 RepID=UPI003CEAFAEF
MCNLFGPAIHLIYIALALSIATRKMCNVSFCNHEGQCFEENGRKTCQCVGNKYFQGLRCTEMSNNCLEEPCQNNGQCQNLVGQFICQNCDNGYGGLWCDIKISNVFQNMILYFNHYGYYSEEHNFLLIMEHLGYVNFSVELMSNNYVIDSFETTSMDSTLKWKYSSNLESIIKQHAIRYYNDLKFQKGYYRLAKEVFWHLDNLKLSLRSYDTETAGSLFYYNEFDILILTQQSVQCVPQLIFLHGIDPLEPLMLDIARFNTFEAVIQRRCLSDSNLVFNWRIFNTIGDKMLHEFGNTVVPMLKVPPYKLWFSYHGEVMSSYSLVIRMVERGNKNIESITEARCFLLLLPKPVKATIVGGLWRQIGITQNLLLDGSRSRDFALAPDSLQDLVYNWDCVSMNNPHKDVCNPKMGAGNKLTLAKGHIEVNHSYTFTLTVSSKVNLFSHDRTQQEVHVVSDPQLQVDIKCRRNCLRDYYAAGHIIHIEGICSECSSSALFYWSVNGITQKENRHLIFYPKHGKSMQLVNLEVHDRGIMGVSTIELKLNTPPTGGHCSIEPTTGIAFETEFYIECENYQDKDIPLQYRHFSDNFPLKQINDPNVYLRLPKSKLLTVVICDQWNACNETTLSVDITTHPQPNNLKEFLMANGTNVAVLIENSQRQTAIILIKTLVDFIKDKDGADLLMGKLHNFKLQTLLEVEQWLAICHDLIGNIEPLDFRKAGSITQYIRKLTQGLQLTLRDKEIETFDIASYKIALRQLVDIIKELGKRWEHFMDVQTTAFPEMIMANDPLAEHYAELSDFDIVITEKLTNWLETSRELDKSLNSLSFQAINIYLPGEPNFHIEDDLTEMRMLAVDNDENQIFFMKNFSIELNLASQTVRDVQRQRGSNEIVLQMGSIERNRFWWYPNEQSVSSNLLYLSIPDLQSPLPLRHPIYVKYQLKTSSMDHEFEVQIKGHRHMPLFIVEMPPNSLLVLKVQNHSYSILLNIGLTGKPSGFQMLFKGERHLNQTSLAFNNNNKSINAFIAFLAAKEVNMFPFSFKYSLDIYQCLYWEWNVEDPQWTTSGCKPKYESTNSQQIECECQHFSNFATRTYKPTVKEELKEHWLLDQLSINWHVVTFYIIFLLLACLATLLINFHRIKNNIPILISDAVERSDIEILVYTGSHWNSSSTANIKFIFVSENGPYSVRVFQNPSKPQLLRNSISKFLLDSQNVKIPSKLIISNDQSGRYPSWYCHKIVITNITTKERQIVVVNNWISKHALEFMPSFKEETPKECFYKHLLNFYNNWFQFQPLWGPTKFADFCSFQRSCIWASQTIVSICIVFCYYGPTSMDSYEKEREIYFYLKFNTAELFLISLICFLSSVLIKMLFKIINKS